MSQPGHILQRLSIQHRYRIEVLVPLQQGWQFATDNVDTTKYQEHIDALRKKHGSNVTFRLVRTTIKEEVIES